MRRATVLLAFIVAVAVAAPAFAQVDSGKLAGMQARSIGPAGMSGRVAAVDLVIDNPDVIYVGAATGGLWKSEDGGTTWNPIFDDQPVHAVGVYNCLVAAGDDDHIIIAGPSIRGVVAVTGHDRIVAGAANHAVIAGAAVE